MDRDYKVGDWVIYMNKMESDKRKGLCGISLYGKIAKIIHIDITYLLEFKDWIDGHDGSESLKKRKEKGKGKSGHCYWALSKKEIKPAIDHLKFKKWIKG